MTEKMPQPEPTLADLIARILQKDTWDLTAISYATASALEPERVRNQPVFLGFLCDDPFRLISPHENQEAITTLYHFKGPSSKHAAKQVMAKFNHFIAEDLNPSALSYFLFSWPPEVALLLKRSTDHLAFDPSKNWG